MKPKKRYQQTQSGRLFLRDKDHRDVVYQDKYHNALMWKDEDGKESIWVRYPRRTCIVALNTQVYALLDVDRRCLHYLNSSINQRTNDIIPLEDLLVYYDYYENIPYVYISEDGQIWKPIQGINQIINGHTFDSHSSYVYSITNVSDAEGYWSVLSITRVNYYKDNEGNWKTSTSSASFRYSGLRNSLGTVKPIGSTHNGLIVIHDVLSSDMPYPYPNHPVSVFKIDEHLNQTYLGEFTIGNESLASFNVKHYTNAQGIQFCQKGSFMCIMVAQDFRSRDSGAYSYFYDRVIMYGSSDNGATWTTTKIYESEEHNQYNGWTHSEPRFRIIYRMSKFYAYFYNSVNENCQCWASDTGLSWYQVNLPQYVDVPIEQNPSGFNTAQFPIYQTVRLKIDINAPNGEGVNVSFFSTFAYVTWNYKDLTSIIDFLNGEQTNVSNKEEHLCFVADGYLFYFDNMALVCNDNCYAIQLATTTDEQSFEYLMEGDYCYRGTTPPIYPYWNPYTQYNVGDIVIYGDTFECLIANKNQVPKMDSIYWRKLEE